MTTYEHIEELRAELAASIDAGERQQIAAELERAVAQHQQEKAAFCNGGRRQLHIGRADHLSAHDRNRFKLKPASKM